MGDSRLFWGCARDSTFGGRYLAFPQQLPSLWLDRSSPRRPGHCLRVAPDLT